VSSELGLVVGAMMDGALALWPGLTKDQFGEAFLHVTGTNTGRQLSIQEMDDLLMGELTRRHGEPRRIGGGVR
jgi:hypothetical protein